MRIICLLLAMSLAVPAWSQSKPDSDAYEGLWISTPYPSIEVAPGKPVSLDLTVHNAGLPPQRVELQLTNAPDQWTTRLLGGSSPVSAVFVGPSDTADVRLELTPPKDAAKGEYAFSLTGQGRQARFELPLEVILGEAPPAQLVLEPELPILPGTPDTTFSYNVDLGNETGSAALVALGAEAPRGFQVSFMKEFGSQKLSSITVDSGQTESLKIEVDPPQGVKAGTYPVEVHANADGVEASTRLKLDVSGQPELSLTAPGGRLSGRAQVGEQTPLQLVLQNQGSAPARNVQLSASQLQGWEVKFEPQRIDALPPQEQMQVKALVTPPANAIAGDYMLTLRASGDNASQRSDYRVTLATSTLWGIAGVGIIAAALAVLGLAVVRYGRR